MSTDDRGPEPVLVLAAEPDLPVAEVIARGLADLGVRTALSTGPDAVPTRVVVLLSTAAARDPSWRARVERVLDSRLVPVQLDEVDPASVPEAVSAPNWVRWSAAGALHAKAAVFAALHSDMTRYARHRVLSARANAWQARGRPDHLLIDSPAAARQAVQHVVDAEHDALARPTDVVRDFVTASSHLTAKSTRSRTRRWAVRLAAVVGAVAVVVGVVTVIRAGVKVNNLQFSGTTMPWMLEERPDRIAMLSAALLLQGDGPVEQVAHQTALDALAQPWSHGLIGAAHPSAIIGAALDRGGGRTVTLDSAGTVTLWDNGSLAVLWREAVDGSAGSGALGASGDLDRIAVSAGTTLHRITARPWHDDPVTLPAEAFQVVVGARVVVARVGEGELVTAPFTGGGVGGRQVYDRVLDLRRSSDGEVRALVRTGDELLVVDPVAGRELTRATWPAPPFEYGAVDPDSGAVFVTGADRQLHHAPDGAAFRPTGQAVADVLDLLEALPDGRVAFGSREFGVRVFDVRPGVRVGELCRGVMSVEEVVVAADGDVVGCLDYLVVDLWSTRALSPLTRPPDNVVGASSAPSATDGGLSATGDGAGAVTITEDGREWRLQPVSSAVTAVSVHAASRSVLVSSDTGSVVQLAVTAAGPVSLGRWAVPDRSGVTGVGWRPDGRQLVVSTRSGAVWTPPGCRSCERADVVVNQVRDRLPGCYTENQIEYLDDVSRARLDVHACERSPDE
ncbi:hypothetical protein ACIGNX_28460 [Actinosynnema sp. NPDC053489]|uniref:hypothetical protein n=1 Tax=Actinosynnema sp. NPDC053489 TaxID=3363916 RepID=UPI0037CAEA7F